MVLVKKFRKYIFKLVIYIYLAQPKSGAPQFLFNSIDIYTCKSAYCMNVITRNNVTNSSSFLELYLSQVHIEQTYEG